MTTFRLNVNGDDYDVDVPLGTSLLEVLRNDIGDKSPKFGCGLGQCGACFVLIGGHPTPACDTPVEYVRGDVRTLAGLGRPEAPSAVQSAFLELQAGQCGYCIGGMIVTATALLRDNPRPTRAEVSAALDRNLCRCGTHARFVDAVLAAAGSAPVAEK
ncbi:(2Fe-2S)-binding protein [Mycolicibacterium sp. BiH015]|uniref:(2Fe-2S)-binding protein n=1 Tax=Mycolicibacterium sp. BiH015 TaxID=3018808 RepID=UPI0022E7F141|nr:(2Fe-2S)-binding protein [Mycolicibacterium sp. BiH015]MDA2892122.1 (2Fe-2S)-binding protein [Mycolicibacterium sp. BiH015]